MPFIKYAIGHSDEIIKVMARSTPKVGLKEVWTVEIFPSGNNKGSRILWFKASRIRYTMVKEEIPTMRDDIALVVTSKRMAMPNLYFAIKL